MTTRVSMDDLVRKVARANGISLVDTKSILESVFSAIKEEVASKNNVSVTKFGTFASAYSKSYTARNPRTGEAVEVPAKQRIKFRPFDGFKSKV